jgi:hypothetical protein
VLIENGLKETANLQWYTEKGWKSSHYKIRYERPYTDIKRTVEAFLSKLKTQRLLRGRIIKITKEELAKIDKLFLQGA